MLIFVNPLIYNIVRYQTCRDQGMLHIFRYVFPHGTFRHINAPFIKLFWFKAPKHFMLNIFKPHLLAIFIMPNNDIRASLKNNAFIELFILKIHKQSRHIFRGKCNRMHRISEDQLRLPEP